MIVGAAHHQEAFVLVGEAVDQFVVVGGVVVGALGQLVVELLQFGLHVEDVFEGAFSLLQHGAFVAEHHHLGEVADGDFARHRHGARGGLLLARQDFQHGGFARAVLAHQGDAVAGIDDEGDILEERCHPKFYF
jgi:hypothetical protein